MSLFKDIVKLWKSDNLLSQAWDESYEMMMLSNEIFTQAIKYLRENEDIDAIKALKKRDVEINRFQKDVRRKVVTHYAITQDVEDLPNGLVLLNMVVDVERVGECAVVAVGHISALAVGRLDLCQHHAAAVGHIGFAHAIQQVGPAQVHQPGGRIAQSERGRGAQGG